MREIILDTETTGLDPHDGHKLVEIGCIEVINQIPTGKTYHTYINPDRDVPAEAVAVHGLTAEFLSKHKSFTEIVGDFTEFIRTDRLVIHNAAFDMKFINYELEQAGFKPIHMLRITDTLMMAREKFPGQAASLDALCKRFGVDNSGRTLHGALLDAQLLAEVYLELMGGRQRGITFADGDEPDAQAQMLDTASKDRKKKPRAPRVFDLPEDEQKAHDTMLGRLTDSLWKKLSEK